MSPESDNPEAKGKKKSTVKTAKKESKQDAKKPKMHTSDINKVKSGIKQGSEKYEEIHFVDSTKPVWNYSLFNEEIIRNFQQGTCYNAYEFFGNKQITVLETPGTYFAVWAPNATRITVTGNFNDWSKDSHDLFVRLDKSGIWEGFIPNVNRGEVYKYHITGFGEYNWIKEILMRISGNINPKQLL